MLFKVIDLVNINCISIKTKPILNSAADNIKKKNVNETKFTLFDKKPISKTIEYRVIHKNSAVSTKCSDVLILTTIDINITVKTIIKKLNSQNNTC